ncbi:MULTISPECIES: flagellar export chaperone FliS [Pantoea]|jgi:flagellar secretion chaperone FliS|uniref:Flagellar secretion chaperone FliS n=1 Tax=Pantoea dispersa TaxID=59814 RepID=A0ABY3A370_9GAMM|nr:MULTISPECIES: flagellar export chaperone FliS [Pantoea]KTS01378.1 flagellar protein FliS [Pantoea dispersa]MBU6517698.1 flagellar export chaperone FliS [Pantoea sp. B270]MCT6588424.1 flagellar export chaperone FliS [Pantoea dispersa]MCW0319831.1 Flagellar secretion chaperone FliS [Pantoea dispersa]MCW0324567.1 Flagellar secretion chaperone FliS [Pantoea dispersa]
MYSPAGRHSYARLDLETQLAGASPHQLITMLLDGALNAMQRARIYFEKGNVARRGEMLSRAINIIDNGLRPALDHEVGGEIAQQLESLYDYVSRTLLKANLTHSAAELPAAIDVIATLSRTWKEIEPKVKATRHG